MKLSGKYYCSWCLPVILLAMASCNQEGRRHRPPMYPPYLYRDKGPMGTNIAARLMPSQFTGIIIHTSQVIKPESDVFAHAEGTAYICIGKEVGPDEEALQQLLHYVETGNEYFIAAASPDYHLLNKLGITVSPAYNLADQLHRQPAYLRIADTAAYGNKLYGFFDYPFRNVFSLWDSTRVQVLGVNANRQANFIMMRYGKGKLYIHLAPSAFSNYFLLQPGNTAYFSQVFSYLNRDAHMVFWADTNGFGKKKDSFSALDIFWHNRLLKYALLTACALLLLHIAFGSKRKRRIIPALPQNRNATLSFVQTITNLYLQKKQNRNIAAKRMAYFFEYARTHYHLAAGNTSAEWIQSLAGKTGVDESRVRLLMEKADYINTVEKITDRELFEINNLIDELYKR